MTREREEADRLAELELLLETWGGDDRRWPPEVRGRIGLLAAGGPRARAAVDEARALDRLLDRARGAPARLTTAHADALADRIVAAALSASPAPTAAPAASPTTAPSRTARVIELQPRRPGPAQLARRQPALGNRWQAASLMAASLLAGIYFGGNVNLAPVVQEFADVVGLQTVVDPALQAGDDLGDEETL